MSSEIHEDPEHRRNTRSRAQQIFSQALSAAWWQNEGDTLILTLYCQPGTRRDAIEGLHGERLKVRLSAPAIDGKANECLRRFLALEFAVARCEVTLLSGERSREKQIAIHSARKKPRWFQDLTGLPT